MIGTALRVSKTKLLSKKMELNKKPYDPEIKKLSQNIISDQQKGIECQPYGLKIEF